jgi:hypothetical protein
MAKQFKFARFKSNNAFKFDIIVPFGDGTDFQMARRDALTLAQAEFGKISRVAESCTLLESLPPSAFQCAKVKWGFIVKQRD